MGKGTVAIHEDIAAFLASHADEGYRAFQAKLIPNIDAATIVGVRTPELRKFAKGLARREDAGEFLAALPHGAFEENHDYLQRPATSVSGATAMPVSHAAAPVFS